MIEEEVDDRIELDSDRAPVSKYAHTLHDRLQLSRDAHEFRASAAYFCLHRHVNTINREMRNVSDSRSTESGTKRPNSVASLGGVSRTGRTVSDSPVPRFSNRTVARSYLCANSFTRCDSVVQQTDTDK